VGSGEDLDSKSLFIIVTYFIVALIHIYFTGNALFHMAARISWHRNEHKFVETGQAKMYQLDKVLEIKPNPNAVPVIDLHAQIYAQDFIAASPIPPKLVVGTHVLEKLLSVGLAQGHTGVMLGGSVQSHLAETLREAIKNEYLHQKGVQPIDLPKYSGEIGERVHRDLDDWTKIGIDPQTGHGILDSRLIAYLHGQWAIDEATITQLAAGQALYRLQTTGLLTDNELKALAGHAPSIGAQNDIALHGLSIQLRQMPEA
jgi:hypothetical protein